MTDDNYSGPLRYWLYIEVWPREWTFGVRSYISSQNTTARKRLFFNYPITAEGQRLYQQWAGEPNDIDGVTSGVFADWLEDNRESLLTKATCSDDAVSVSGRLDHLIQWLRIRYTGTRQ
jgi:hypothetical protein